MDFTLLYTLKIVQKSDYKVTIIVLFEFFSRELLRTVDTIKKPHQ